VQKVSETEQAEEGGNQKMTEKKHVFWFDIALTYKELAFLNKEAEKRKLSHMDYLAELLREKIEEAS